MGVYRVLYGTLKAYDLAGLRMPTHTNTHTVNINQSPVYYSRDQNNFHFNNLNLMLYISIKTSAKNFRMNESFTGDRFSMTNVQISEVLKVSLTVIFGWFTVWNVRSFTTSRWNIMFNKSANSCLCFNSEFPEMASLGMKSFLLKFHNFSRTYCFQRTGNFSLEFHSFLLQMTSINISNSTIFKYRWLLSGWNFLFHIPTTLPEWTLEHSLNGSRKGWYISHTQKKHTNTSKKEF